MKKRFVYPCFALLSLSTLIGCKGGGGGSKEKTYTVKFETYSGTPKPEDQVVKEGNTATRPSMDPGTITTKEGDEYTFVDWYTSPETMEKFNFSNPITSDVTVYAHYDGGFQISGKTNVDYNDKSDTNLTFKVINKFGDEDTGFTYDTYFPDFPDTKISINSSTGKLYLAEETSYIYGFVYAYRENSKTSAGYDYAIKPIHIASFDCLEYKKLGETDNYDVSFKDGYSFTDKDFVLCIPEVYYEDNKGILGTVTNVCTSSDCKTFSEFLSSKPGQYATLYISDSIEEIGDYAFGNKEYKYCSRAYVKHISSNIRKIGKGAFRYCNGDFKTSFDYDFSNSKLESIGDFAFDNAYLKQKKIKLPSTLNLVGPRAFYSDEYYHPASIEFADPNHWVEMVIVH